MRRPVLVLAGFAALAVVVVLVLAGTYQERRAFTLGVVLSGPALNVAPAAEVCQSPVTIPDDQADFDRVRFTLATLEPRPGPAVDVTLKTLDGETVARGRVPGGYQPGGELPQSVDVGHVTTREPMQVCLKNAGDAPVALFGSGDLASRTSTATLAGAPTGVDVGLSFAHAEPRSGLSLLPAFFDRMALWRAGWIGGWTYWLLAAVVALVVPALLVVALRGALDAPRD